MTSPARHSVGDCEVSEKYSEFIQTHIEAVKSRCKEYKICINELLETQNFLSISSGENVDLLVICRMVQVNSTNQYALKLEKCSVSEREEIRNEIEAHLKDTVLGESSWKKINRCLETNYGDDERTTYVNDTCRLAATSSEGKRICNRPNYEKVEQFFNDQLQHLKCTCDSLTADSGGSAPLGAIIGGAVGGVTLLILAILLAVFCMKYKKAKQNKGSPRVIYLPAPNSDPYHPYQEPFDPYDPRYQPSPPSNPPPVRNNSSSEENPYLEPVTAGAYRYRGRALPPIIDNPGYGDPPEYSEREEAAGGRTSPPAGIAPSPADGASAPADGASPPADRASTSAEYSYGYFDPLPSPKEEEENSNYDALLPNQDDPSPSKYEPLNSVKEKKLGPDPAERTKKEDRETESTYFELEKVSDEEEQSTPTHTTV